MYNVQGLLSALDILIDHVDTKSDGEVEYYARCPYHFADEDGRVKVDHSPSWSIKHSTGEHNCWSCGFHGSPIWLVYKVLDLEWDEACAFADKYTDSIAAILEMDPWDGSRPSLSQRLPINDARLYAFGDPPLEALTARRIEPGACEVFGVRWDHKTLAWITPIRDPQDYSLWGWQMKGAEPGSRLFRNFPFGVKKSETLFGIDVWDERDQVWVVESPLDCLRLWSIGFKAVSTYGANVTRTQHELLLGYESVIVAMDNDDSGRKASLDLLDYARRIPMKFFNYGDSTAKDVGDMSDDEVMFGYENARHALWGRKALGL